MLSQIFIRNFHCQCIIDRRQTVVVMLQFQIANILSIYFIFVIYHLSYFVIKPWWIFVITSDIFVGEKIVKNVKHCFIEKTDLIMKHLYPQMIYPSQKAQYHG